MKLPNNQKIKIKIIYVFKKIQGQVWAIFKTTDIVRHHDFYQCLK